MTSTITTIKGLMAVLLCSMLSACVSNPTFTPPPERPLPAANFQPSAAELEGNPIHVWLHVNSSRRQDALKVEDAIMNRWVEKLRKNGVTLHEPNASSHNHLSRLQGKRNYNRQNTLKDLITAAGYSSSGEYLGKQTVDYVLEVNINRAEFKQDYSDPIWCPFCEDKRPGTCEYEMEAHFDLNLKPLPEYRTLKSFWFEASENDDFEAFKCPHKSSSRNSEMYRDMREEIIDEISECGSDALQAFLTPKAYILSYFSDGQRHYFEISGGTTAGFKAGQDIEIQHIENAGKHNLERHTATTFAKGEVHFVKPNRAYIEVSDLTVLEHIKKYDLVKVVSDSLISKSMNQLSCMSSVTEL